MRLSVTVSCALAMDDLVLPLTNAARSIGVHVPRDVPARSEDRARELRGHELFTTPGEVREIR